MSWSRGRSVREHIMTPRHCKKCGQWMSEEFLKERAVERGKRISAANRGKVRKEK
jgi:hypothetical protein